MLKQSPCKIRPTGMAGCTKQQAATEQDLAQLRPKIK